jgi:PTS system ascorbate-specific IIA component
MSSTLEITPQEIQLRVTANTWEDAIKVASKPLIDSNRITNDYVTNMINSVKKLGPYIVIAPGLALGHARPSAAVKKTSFSIATLQHGVEFGSKANDPVDLIIILASTSNTAHLSLLQKIVTFLNDRNNLKELREARSHDDAVAIANKINGGQSE